MPEDQGIAANDPILKLSGYFVKADRMHDLVHWMRDEYTIPVIFTRRDGTKLQFEAYLDFWLAGLFVVVEGFNKLRLQDDAIRRLLKQDIGRLKLFRDETYHFSPGPPKSNQFLVDSINWAEDLHEAFADYFRDYIIKYLHPAFPKTPRVKKRPWGEVIEKPKKMVRKKVGAIIRV
jgi:hypothetical protein